AAKSAPKKAAAEPASKKKAAVRTPPSPAAPAEGAQPTPASLRAAAAKHERSDRLQDALQCLVRAEQLGDRTTKRDIARLHLVLRDRSNRSVDRKQHLRQAVQRYRDLAERGDVEAMLALVGLDSGNAFAWRLRAAQAGNIQAMRQVARTQLKVGDDEHVQAALSWLLEAAKAGDGAAILEGARAHEQRGAYGNAIDWYRWAEENGVPGAAKEVARVTAEHPGSALWHRWSERLRRLKG
ncbi:hypothetical protein AB0B78_01020, partial [Streptomyces sp. NPDC040724]|uniref:hypothetical protein n=1 Tax=Streptomyces sp. NPDC040724 TaxID=3155612 RepID=UPI0033D8BAFC